MANHASLLERLVPALLAPALLAPALLVGAAAAQSSHTTNNTPPRLFVTNSGGASVGVVDSESHALLATIPVGLNPQDIVFTARGDRALVANMTSDTVSVIETATLTVIATVPVSDAPRSLVATRDGSKAYVGCANGVVDVIDLATFTWSASISVGGPYADSVNGLCVSPDGSRVYALWGNLIAIDTRTDAVVASIYAGNTPTSLALSPDGAFAYVPCAFGYGAFVFAGSLATVDLASGAVVNSTNLWSIPSTISISPDGTTAIVANQSVWANTGYAAGFLPSPWVTRVDLVSHTLAGGFNAVKPAGESQYDTDASELFIAVPSLNHVKVIDPLTLGLVGTIATGTSPRAMALEPVMTPAPTRPLSPAAKRRL
jgi:YVTN family beta-propeller protein